MCALAWGLALGYREISSSQEIAIDEVGGPPRDGQTTVTSWLMGGFLKTKIKKVHPKKTRKQRQKGKIRSLFCQSEPPVSLCLGSIFALTATISPLFTAILSIMQTKRGGFLFPIFLWMPQF